MPIHPIHLAQTATARGWAKSVGTSAKDAQLINGLIEVAENPLLQTKTVYVSKRGGSTTGATIGTTGETVVLKVMSQLNDLYVSGTTPALFKDTTSLGTIDGIPSDNLNVCEAIISSNRVYAFAAGGSGWFLYEDAVTKNFPTFSASLASGQATVTGLASTGGIYDGQLFSASGIPSSTRVSDVLDSSRILLSQAATETGSKTITKEAVAKIIDSTVSGVVVSSMSILDGYFFLSGSGNNENTIYQSALNDPTSWTGSDTVSADLTGDAINCLFRIKDYIAAAGRSGVIQYFYNAGNATGSILSPSENMTIDGVVVNAAPVFIQSGGYFVGSDVKADASSGSFALYRITGVNEIERISDSIWSGIITDGFYTKVHTAVIGGRLVVVLAADLTNGSALSIVYDPTVNHFSFLQFASGNLLSSYGNRFSKHSALTLFAWSSGNTWTDSDSAYALTVQTEPQDMAQGADTTDTWVDLVADVESSGTATLEVTDDDYQNWVSKGSFDMTKNKKRINALGLHQGPRAYRLQHSANTGFRGQILRVNHQPSSL